MFSFKKAGPVEWLVVGLGNPGPKYEWTRHNVGFLVVDELAERASIPVQKLKYKALTNTTVIGGQSVLLMKPTTYMNLSGESVGQAARFYKIPPERVLVISDDVALPQGKLRIRRSGSAGGHNGLKNIIAHLGTDQFPRLKVGVGGKPYPDSDMADWVLGKFTGQDKAAMEQAIAKAAPGCAISLHDLDDKQELKAAIDDCHILSNATRVGMEPNTEQSLITDLDWLRSDLVVTDVVYAPPHTKLLRDAQSAGCKTCDGLGMLLCQGAEAFRLYSGLEMPVEEIRALLYA